MRHTIFVPTLVDANNLNAQVNNACAILSGWNVPGWRVNTLAYYEPDPRVAANSQIQVIRLWRRHAWYAHLFLRYLRPYDLIFYPGVYPMDTAGLRWRRRLGFSAPVVVTLEGLLGDSEREAEYTALARHPVYCQHVPKDVLARVDDRNRRADHIIAISPFLAKMGMSRFGDKFSVLPLGIDSTLYYSEARKPNARLRVVSAGSVKCSKRPELFLELARRYAQADFVWYGEGEMRIDLIAQARQKNLTNLNFPGALSPHLLGEAFRAADIFIMPSKSEGVPKVTQEAAACGLAQVIFGYYEAPSVIDGQNGFVVWSDEVFMDKVGELIDNPLLVEAFGKAGAEMALAWDWAVVARQWRKLVTGLIKK
jgi:glycosyltransferase involved in cell wall biosynthesis